MAACSLPASAGGRVDHHDTALGHYEGGLHEARDDHVPVFARALQPVAAWALGLGQYLRRERDELGRHRNPSLPGIGSDS